MKDLVIYEFLKLNLSVAILALVVGVIYRFLGDTNIAMSIINLGLFLIIMSPVLRIILELFFFIKQRNYTYILVCLALFVIIAISIIC